MKSIPVDQLRNKTNAGLQIKAFWPDSEQQSHTENAEAHRDDHYIFFLITGGYGTMMVDLQHINLTAGELYYILPSQIHHRIKTYRAEGWFLAIDTSLVPPDLITVFERRLNLQQPCQLTEYHLKQYLNLLHLLHNEFTNRQHDKHYLSIVHALGQSFLAMAASTYDNLEASENKQTRPAELARQFKTLLAANSHTVKSPSAYASKLNVSTGYLNEAIKEATGSTVSYWIQQEIFMEAKRLLYHSNAGVKQIAYELGYNDHYYFIRSFSKAAGLSPSKFRLLNRR